MAWGNDHGEYAYVQKTTGWITSCREIAQALSKFQCPNRNLAFPELHHRHVSLVDGKAKAMRVYTRRLVLAILKAFVRRLRNRREISINASEVGIHGHFQ